MLQIIDWNELKRIKGTLSNKDKHIIEQLEGNLSSVISELNARNNDVRGLKKDIEEYKLRIKELQTQLKKKSK
jgi:polyhydroxyalkanoate synthesis regulator phasin